MLENFPSKTAKAKFSKAKFRLSVLVETFCSVSPSLYFFQVYQAVLRVLVEHSFCFAFCQPCWLTPLTTFNFQLTTLLLCPPSLPFPPPIHSDSDGSLIYGPTSSSSSGRHHHRHHRHHRQARGGSGGGGGGGGDGRMAAAAAVSTSSDEDIDPELREGINNIM